MGRKKATKWSTPDCFCSGGVPASIMSYLILLDQKVCRYKLILRGNEWFSFYYYSCTLFFREHQWVATRQTHSNFTFAKNSNSKFLWWCIRRFLNVLLVTIFVPVRHLKLSITICSRLVHVSRSGVVRSGALCEVFIVVQSQICDGTNWMTR